MAVTARKALLYGGRIWLVNPATLSPARPSSGQGVGTPIGGPPLVGSFRFQRDARGELVLTSRIDKTYPWIWYFISQKREKVSTTGVCQPQAFRQVTPDYLEEWGWRDRELQKKINLFNSQG